MELMKCNNLAYISLARLHYKNFVPGNSYTGGQPQIHGDCGSVYRHKYKHYVALVGLLAGKHAANKNMRKTLSETQRRVLAMLQTTHKLCVRNGRTCTCRRATCVTSM